MAVFTDEELSAFLLGVMVRTPASTPDRFYECRYLADDRLLVIGFGDASGHVAHYDYLDIPWDMAEDFARASSKGVWIDRRLKKSKWAYRPSVLRP